MDEYEFSYEVRDAVREVMFLTDIEEAAAFYESWDESASPTEEEDFQC